ncbi:hypothetical protein CH267_00875 [Rhodococcus sp. 06-621-2]|nr:hypothetical protein [Rhodococcus sp. 06-621-2]OZC62127.1 hypothetical protein CH267_00875 [Rhodococcus sp. 06-621-2]
MSDLVPSADIEAIVGADRHRKAHLGRAVSAQQRVYILHSQQCLDSGIDLRECRFSKALDDGIEVDRWAGSEDMPVVLGVWGTKLVVIKRLAGSGDRDG